MKPLLASRDYIAIALIAAVAQIYQYKPGYDAAFYIGHYIGALIGSALLYALVKKVVVGRKPRL